MFRHPKHMGEIKNPDATGTLGNPQCGDVMKLFLKIERGKIKDAKFQTFGCVSAIATTEALCKLVIGKTLAEAKSITAKQIEEYLGGLPKIKFHCTVLGNQTLKKAIEDYEKK